MTHHYIRIPIQQLQRLGRQRTALPQVRGRGQLLRDSHGNVRAIKCGTHTLHAPSRVQTIGLHALPRQNARLRTKLMGAIRQHIRIGPAPALWHHILHRGTRKRMTNLLRDFHHLINYLRNTFLVLLEFAAQYAEQSPIIKKSRR